MSKANVTLNFKGSVAEHVDADLAEASETVLVPLTDATDESDVLDIYRNESDGHIDKAKQVVADNYNAHRDRGKTPEITTEQLHIVWFVKALENWKAIVVSPVIRGLLYEVSYNGRRGEVYLRIYKKINDVKILD